MAPKFPDDSSSFLIRKAVFVRARWSFSSSRRRARTSKLERSAERGFSTCRTILDGQKVTLNFYGVPPWATRIPERYKTRKTPWEVVWTLLVLEDAVVWLQRPEFAILELSSSQDLFFSFFLCFSCQILSWKKLPSSVYICPEFCHLRAYQGTRTYVQLVISWHPGHGRRRLEFGIPSRDRPTIV